MDRTVRIQLLPTPEQTAALRETLGQFTTAFNLSGSLVVLASLLFLSPYLTSVLTMQVTRLPLLTSSTVKAHSGCMWWLMFLNRLSPRERKSSGLTWA